MPHRRDFKKRMVRPAGEVVVAPLALDALSAALAKRVGFNAIYLGGGGLGYARAVTEAMLTATELGEATRAIHERVDIHIVVDGGIGFGDPVHMGRTIRMIEDAGAAAIEIEDQVAPKRVHHHKGVEHLVSTEMMRWRIEAAVEARRDSDLVLIVRCNAISHEGMQGALERAAAYAEAGADLLMLMHRNQTEFEAVSAGTTLPLAAMTIGPGRTREAMLASGYALEVDPMSATVLGFRAMQAGYQGIRDRAGFGMSREEVMAVIHEVGATIGIEALYAVEERTTERG